MLPFAAIVDYREVTSHTHRNYAPLQSSTNKPIHRANPIAGRKTRRIMKIVILAAGYGTRLAKDLARTQSYRELRGVPKPLLPIAGAPLLSHWMHAIRTCPLTADCDVLLVVSSRN